MTPANKHWFTKDREGYGPTWRVALACGIAAASFVIFRPQAPWMVVIPMTAGAAFFFALELCQLFLHPPRRSAVPAATLRKSEEYEYDQISTGTATHSQKRTAPNDRATQIAAVLSKGQALLNLNKPDEAMIEFDEAVQIDPRSIEAWIKRGTALEQLQRVDEAIASYNEAISIDGSTATAYLFKAGVYNRQKKYAEALQCYEKALIAQKSKRPRGDEEEIVKVGDVQVRVLADEDSKTRASQQ